MGNGGVEREGCDHCEMSEQRPPPGSHLPCPVKSLPSPAPGCSLPPLGPGSLLPRQKLGWELPLSLLVASLPCWTCFSCPAGAASSTETHPGCGLGSPAGFFRGKGNKTQTCLNPGGRKRTEIGISLSSLIFGSEDPQGANAAGQPHRSDACSVPSRPRVGKGFIRRGSRRCGSDPTDLPDALPKAKTQRGSRGAESPAPSPACCRPPIQPGASPARPFLGIHQILPLKAKSERRPRSPARSLVTARDCSRARSRFGEEHGSV